jgi:putative Mn2+ efflux pump MntP
MLEVALVGLSLSMDALAVSVSAGISIPGLRVFHALRASFLFGLFQFLMPLAGWFLGSAFLVYAAAYDHWIAFGLLALIGAKMIREAFRAGHDSGGAADLRSFGVLLVLALATSIDALAVGVSFSFLDTGIWESAALIGAITFTVCLTGFEAGKRFRRGRLLGRGAQIAGGLILIGIGLKILIEHFAAPMH